MLPHGSKDALPFRSLLPRRYFLRRRSAKSNSRSFTTTAKSYKLVLLLNKRKCGITMHPRNSRACARTIKIPTISFCGAKVLCGAELTKVGLDHFNNLRSTGEIPGGNSNVKNFSLMSTTIRLRPSGQVRARTDYVVLDTSKSFRHCPARPGLSGCSAGRH